MAELSKPETERTPFEAWLRIYFGENSNWNKLLARDERGDYDSSWVQSAWDGWAARASIPAQTTSSGLRDRGERETILMYEDALGRIITEDREEHTNADGPCAKIAREAIAKSAAVPPQQDAIIDQLRRTADDLRNHSSNGDVDPATETFAANIIDDILKDFASTGPLPPQQPIGAELFRASVAADPVTPQERVLIESPIGTLFDPANHHNALLCPYCNPDGLTLASSSPQESSQQADRRPELFRRAAEFIRNHDAFGDQFSQHDCDLIERAHSYPESRDILNNVLQAHEMEKRVLYEALERALSHLAVIGTDQAKRAAQEIEDVLDPHHSQEENATADDVASTLSPHLFPVPSNAGPATLAAVQRARDDAEKLLAKYTVRAKR